MDTIHFAELSSAIPDPRLRAAARRDPLFDGLSEQLGAAVPLKPKTGTSGEPSSEWLDAIKVRRTRDIRLDTLAAIRSWDLLSAEQLAAFVGDERVAGSRSPAVAELLEVGAAGVVPRPTLRGDRLRVVRWTGDRRVERLVEPALTKSEWISTFGGIPHVGRGPASARPMLAAELGLRIAEFCEVEAVLPAVHSGITNIDGGPIHSLEMLHGDLTLVRGDGLRVVVELVTSSSPAVQMKVERWARYAHQRQRSDTGVVVVFVAVDQVGAEVSRSVAPQLRNIVKRASKLWPGAWQDPTSSRLLVGEWRRWFPERLAASPGFLPLEAEVLGSAGEFVERALLDPSDVTFDPGPDFDALGVTERAATLRATPHWLRRAPAKPSWPESVKALGLQRLPQPHAAALRIGVPRGAAGQVRAPWRIE
ncbi:hypothetical protein [Gryllotalpicola protaetiae]|uniref:Uncharacterized protein n=1 Tax=Gryllotalpicola protaetiae TaxID=2419771 RepID=A0A387BL98_9MICO|nr:hypothetical protein [Gryllotalpicola protaetiae]AYG03438.1 hypothetical protein D7I44_07735 [Gryllotalpicola protaetiae]